MTKRNLKEFVELEKDAKWEESVLNSHEKPKIEAVL
jgi:hypothetical protein